ncbi:MAG: hypothetical protein C5B48_02260 [Candidatus Rokuibacteriota bacterium]|nr:MAG: hypothetical protein C5B48_02260 [Candidatus Rokubacteria bacterium]
MTLDEFRATTTSPTPPDVPPALVALWHDARGDWNAAHEAAQRVEDTSGAWVHAYLHRKEGDAGNANYWYGQAKRPAATGTLDDEWSEIVRALLSGS